MKLKRTVGKGTFPDKADVITVQTALATIKNKRGKPYYQGKIDGKQSPTTLDAIAVFQAENGLPVSGKIEPSSRTWSLVKQKLPASAKAAPMTMGLSEAEKMKLKQEAQRRSVKALTRNSYPRKDGVQLGQIIVKAAEKGLLLKMGEADVDSTGCITVCVEIEHQAGTMPEIKTQAFQTLSNVAMGFSRWKLLKGPIIKLATVNKIAALAGTPVLDPEITQALKRHVRCDCKVKEKLIRAGFAELVRVVDELGKTPIHLDYAELIEKDRQRFKLQDGHGVAGKLTSTILSVQEEALNTKVQLEGNVQLLKGIKAGFFVVSIFLEGVNITIKVESGKETDEVLLGSAVSLAAGIAFVGRGAQLGSVAGFKLGGPKGAIIGGAIGAFISGAVYTFGLQEEVEEIALSLYRKRDDLYQYVNDNYDRAQKNVAKVADQVAISVWSRRFSTASIAFNEDKTTFDNYLEILMGK